MTTNRNTETKYEEQNVGKIKNLGRTSEKGWMWDVVERTDGAGEDERYGLVEYRTNDAGEGLWVTGKDYDGSVKYTQIEGTGQFGTAYGSQTRSAIRARLVRYFEV